ncbi:MAG: YeaC family protein [Pseudomonadales bacterium]|nr:YeaC family protein [Pseudomonadales bacterium]
MTEFHDQSAAPALPSKPASWDALVGAMSPHLHASLKIAVELGRWPNGERLTPAQREDCLQAIIAWDERHLPAHERVGYIDRSALHKSHCDD